MKVAKEPSLAEAIHDEPIQRIVAGILRLDHIGPSVDPVVRVELDAVAEQLVGTVDWLRDLIVVGLTPPDLSLGLGPALAGLARSIFTSTPTVFSLIGPDHVPLSVPAKEAAFRIFREALGNVRKHANATTATLRLEHREGHIVISLTDDGVGSASLDAGTGHLGMATMRARADGEGGKLNIESVPGLGTVVSLSLPALTWSETTATGQWGAGIETGGPHFLRTIVVCDDHQYLRDAIKLVLSGVPRFHVVGEASDGERAWSGSKLPAGRPHSGCQHARRWPAAGGGRQDAEPWNAHRGVLRSAGRTDQECDAGGRCRSVHRENRSIAALVEALDKVVASAQESVTRPT